jgi:hypothetical protein
VISVGDNTKISVTKFIDDKKTQEKHASFNMLKGKVMFYTMRLFRYKTATMTVDTPTAIAGVRGTKFGVEVASLKEETDTAGKPVYLADASDRAFIHLAQANPPTGSVTNVHAFDGNLYVTNTTTNQTQSISTGQSTSSTPAGLGPVVSTPPGVAQQFQQSTGGSGSGGSGGGTTDTTTNAGGTSTGVDTATNTANVAQTQNTQTVSPEPTQPTRIQPWTGSGYFTGLLSVDDDGRNFEGTYISTTPQNFAAAVTAGDLTGLPYSITADGPSESVTGIATSVYGIFAGSKPVTTVELGYNEYMSWGSWTQPLAMTTDNETDLFLDNPNYYVGGTVTPSLPQTGTYDYSGPAQGTLYSTAGGTVMSGGFTANVNFITAQITDYNMAVANGANAASISIPGAIAINPGQPHFSANQNTGTWTLIVNGIGAEGNVSAQGSGRLYGSFFGPNAENMGAAWAMRQGANNAAGIAIGNFRQPTVP